MLKDNSAPTYRLVAFPDDEEPVLFGIFFRVLFNCHEKEAALSQSYAKWFDEVMQWMSGHFFLMSLG